MKVDKWSWPLLILTTATVVAVSYLLVRLIDYYQLHWSLGILQLSVIHNTGLAFSLAQDWYLVWYLPIVTLALIVFFFVKDSLKDFSLVKALFSGLVVGGGLNNILERAFNGYVTDYFKIWILPVFNVADVCLFIGLIGWIILKVSSDEKV